MTEVDATLLEVLRHKLDAMENLLRQERQKVIRECITIVETCESHHLAIEALRDLLIAEVAKQ